MEINHSNKGKSEQIIWILDELQDTIQAKTYTCTFCNRGFSNAQALGGHMNIHRKDRARLKLQASSDESLLSLGISSSASLADQPEVSGQNNLLLSESSTDQDRSNICKRSSSLSIKDDHANPKSKDGSEELQKLTPFVGTSKERNSTWGDDEDTMMEMSCGSSQVELDLELRLGPEPNETSTRSTRDFF